MHYIFIGVLMVILCIVLCNVSASSAPQGTQNLNDSLLRKIEIMANDTDEVILYIKLSDLNNYNDSKKAIGYAQRAIEIATKSQYHTGIAKGQFCD